MTISGLPPVISQTLAAFADRQRRVLVLRGAGEAAVVLVVGWAGVAAIDALARPSHGWHLVLSLSAYGAAGTVLAVRGLLPLLARPRQVETAHAIERLSEHRLEERLSSAVELAGRPAGGISEWMVSRTIALAAQEAAGLDVIKLVSHRPAQRAWMRTGVVVALLVGACVVPGVPSYLARAAWPSLLRPSHIQLEVLPGDQRLALGAAIDFQVKASPDPGAAQLAITWDDGVAETMTFEAGAAAGHFGLHLPAITRSLTYRVLAGDGESRTYRVDVASPPLFSKIALRITPPSYSGLPVREVDGGDAEMLAGSTVAITAQLAGETAASGSVVFDGGEHAANIEGALLHAELKPATNVAYGLRLVGTGGLVAEPAQRWILTVLPDRAPTVKLSGAGLDSGLIGPDEALMLSAEVTDDLGLRGVEVVVTVDGKERLRRQLPIGSSRREAKLPVAIDLAGIELALGEQVSITARATDLGGQATLSQPLALAVTGADDARGAAQAARLRAVLKQLELGHDALRAMARTWSSLSRDGNTGDAASQQSDLILMTNRIGVWSADMTQVAAKLRDEGMGGGTAMTKPLMEMGDEFTAWVRGAERQLAGVCQDCRVPKISADDLTRGRDLAEAAFGDIQSFRRDLSLVVARLEAAGLTGAADAAQARSERAIAVARGDRGWRGANLSTKPGLTGVFWGGRDFQGSERFREVAVPIFRNRDVPSIGHDNYCARYSGEVFVPTAGEWVFSAGADDGVRLRVAGKNLLPGEAWRDQGFTEFRGKLRLEAGWHAIELETFQGSGESGLGLSLGLNEQSLVPVSLANLRTKGAVDPGALVKAMSDLPREQVAACNARLTQSLGITASVPEQITRIATVAGNDELVKLANSAAASARKLTEALPRVADWSLGELAAAEQDGAALVAVARRARELLNEQVQRELRERTQAGDLSGMRQSLARLRERSHDLREIPERMPVADRQARLRQETTAARAWVAQAGTEAVRERRQLFAAARRPDASLASRAAALHGARRVAEFQTRARLALAEIAQLPTVPQQAADRLNDQLNRMNQELNETQQWERRLLDRQVGERAQLALDELVELDRLRQWSAAQAEGNYPKLSTQVQQVARLERSGANYEPADRLEAPLGKTMRQARLPELNDRLRELARDGEKWWGGFDRSMAEMLARSADDLGKRPQDARTIDDTVLDLDEARLALAVEGEKRRSQDKDQIASAFAALSDDIGRVVDAGQTPTPQQVKEFAERAAVLANMRGDQPRKEAIAKAAERAATPPDATKLDALADKAEKAANQEKERKELVAELEKLADTPKHEAEEKREAAAERKELGSELKELARRDAELRAEEQAARKAFAEAERKLEQQLATVGEQAKAAAERNPGELAKALQQAQSTAPETGAQAHALADAAAKMPSAEAKPDAAASAAQDKTSAQLVQEAKALADHLEQKAAQPLAERFQQATAAQTTADQAANRQAAAEVGRALADAVAAQREAAERLERVVNEQDANREQLAEAIQQAQAQPEAATPSPAATAQKQANEAQNQADQAQANAEAAQEQADAAEKRADQAAANANANATEAKQQAQQADARAAQAEQAAVAAQQKALDAQLAALAKAAEAPPQGAQAAAADAQQLAQATENLARAEQNSLEAVANASPQENAAARPETGAQAAENLKRASQALQGLAAKLPQAAQALAGQLASKDPQGDAAQGAEPGNPEAGQGQPEGQGQPGQEAGQSPSQGEKSQGEKGQGQQAGQGENQPGDAADAAADALAQIHAAPNQQGAYQRAAQILATAAQQARMSQQLGQGQGKGQGQGQQSAQGQGKTPGGKPGGENQGTAKSTGDAGTAAGMRKSVAGADQADWARSKADTRGKVRSGGVEQFSEEHQEPIRAYLKRLGDDK